MDAVTLDKKFKRLREAKTLAVAAFALFMKTGNPTFINLNESDPPDGFLMRGSNDKFGTLDILKVEISHYFARQNETLLEQLYFFQKSLDRYFTYLYYFIFKNTSKCC